MEFLFAPMEGITFALFRQIHHMMFPGITEYYTPFIAPDSEGSFKPKYLRDLTSDRSANLSVIPQILANNATAFSITAGKLQALGFTEFNLNAGCPSGTVFAKHKGAGMLADLSSLDAFLDQVFSESEQKGYRISIKTRMGVHSTQEFPAILELYSRYPLSRLIIHARDRDGQYQSEPDIPGFSEALKNCSCPVSYNGNLFSQNHLDRLLACAPDTKSVMLGRGIIANPALARTLSGREPLQCQELEQFHDTLLEGYLQGGLSSAFAVERMKQLWYYMNSMFSDDKKEIKALLKSKILPDYRAAALTLFRSEKFCAENCFQDNTH